MLCGSGDVCLAIIGPYEIELKIDPDVHADCRVTRRVNEPYSRDIPIINGAGNTDGRPSR